MLGIVLGARDRVMVKKNHDSLSHGLERGKRKESVKAKEAEVGKRQAREETKVESEINAATAGEAGRGQSGPCAGGRPWWGRAQGGQRPATGSHPGASAHSSYFSV